MSKKAKLQSSLYRDDKIDVLYDTEFLKITNDIVQELIAHHAADATPRPIYTGLRTLYFDALGKVYVVVILNPIARTVKASFMLDDKTYQKALNGL